MNLVKVVVFALNVLLMNSCAAQSRTQSVKDFHDIQPGNGMILGTFSIKGYLPDKPILLLSRTDGSWNGEVKFSSLFGTKYDIPKRHANIFLFEVPAGEYRVDGTQVTKSLVIPERYIWINNKFKSHTDLRFKVEPGKINYVGDLFFLFDGGFGGLTPQVKKVVVSDQYLEDYEVIAAKFGRIDKYEISKEVAE